MQAKQQLPDTKQLYQIWQPEQECMSRKDLSALQLIRLVASLKKVYNNVPFYRQLFEEKGIVPEDIQSLSDLCLLPFTTKDALRENYPLGLIAVPRQELIRVHASSGTTGIPTVVAYTKKDLENWSHLIARALTGAGATKNSIIQNSFGYGLFTGGMGIHYGAEAIGATTIPMSGGNTKRQVNFIKDLGVDMLTCTPSYALFIAEVMAEMGIHKEDLQLRAGLFGAEPWTDQMRQRIEEKLGLLALDIYGLSEVIGPGVACECHCQNGLHVYEDHFIPEIIDPVTGEVLPDGAVGELVLTTLTKEALPIIRYRTHDITAITYEQCACGRTQARIARFTGRTDDMLVIRGVNIFPSQVESVLLSIGNTEPHYLLIVDRKGSLDVLEVWVEVSDKLFSDKISNMEQLEKIVRQEIDAILGIAVDVKFVEPKTIPRSEGKAQRVIDRRNK
jgi:phenylacetate-CoA ligase